MTTDKCLQLALDVISRELLKLDSLSQTTEFLDKSQISTLSDLTKTLIQLQKENREVLKVEDPSQYSDDELAALVKELK